MGRRKTLHEKLWTKIDVRGPDECWPWTSVITRSTGYGMLQVRKLGDRNKRFCLSAHRLVYEDRIGPIPPGHLVRHTCHNRLCCNPCHLQIGTHADNSRDMIDAGRSLTGARNPRAKLTISQVAEIRHLRANGATLKSLGEQFGVHLATIGYICQNKSWSEQRESNPRPDGPKPPALAD